MIFILLMQFLWKYIDDLANKGLEISILAELMFYVSASLVPLALPLAILMASLMTMGSMGENYELTAMKASGISLQRIVAPLALFCVVLSIFGFLFSNYILPISNLKMNSLIWDITNQKPELNLREGIFYNGIDGYSIRIGKKDFKTKLLTKIMIYDQKEGNGDIKVIVADSGHMEVTSDKKYLMVRLYDGYNYEEMNRSSIKKPAHRDKFSKQEIRIPLNGLNLTRTDESLFKQNYKMMSIRQLKKYSDSLQIDVGVKTNQLYKSLMHSQILRYRPSIIKNKINIDSLNIDSLKRLNFDTLYNKVPAQQKSSMVGDALSAARESKTYITSVQVNIEDIARRMRKYQIEWWRKFTLSGACLIFFFIGAPLGAIIRKGGLGMPVVISVLFFVLYYIISISGEKIAREGFVDPGIGMWLSGIVLLAAGIFLTQKATRESTILNVDTYINFFKKFSNLLSKKTQ